MKDRLTIVVTCANRKSLPVSPALRFRSVPPGALARRVDTWISRLASSEATRTLDKLYQGEGWTESLKLPNVARSVGFDPTLLVVSAGLGLQGLDAKAPGYAATLALRHADAVANSVELARQWWTDLTDRLSGLTLTGLTGPVLLVLSNTYVPPLADDLAALGTRGDGVCLLGGALEFDGVHHVPTDAALRQSLGGTRSSINQRMAAAFLRVSGGPAQWLSSRHLERWERWESTSRVVERYDRQRGSDDEVRVWIRRTRRADSSLSATSALRAYRDQGMACEQARFGGLFREVVRDQ